MAKRQNKFPPRDRTHAYPNMPSVRVIVRVAGHEDFHFARYEHETGVWRVEHIEGQVEVKEWWVSPAKGTGTSLYA